MKIVYCLNNLYQLGGIVKIVSFKVNILAKNPNNKIFIIVLDERFKPLFEISSNIKIICLHINHYTIFNLQGLKYYYSLFKLVLLHKKRLKKVLSSLNPDIVISVGEWEKNILPFIKGSWKIIREYHFSKNYRDFFYYSNKALLNKIIKKTIEIIEDKLILNKYNKIVLLTHEDKNTNWEGWRNIEVIPNPTTLKIDFLPDLNNKKVISIGRLTDQKNFQSLIEIFCKISHDYPEWILEIYGDGDEKNNLRNLITNLNLQNKVFLKGETINVNEIYLKASIFALTSKFEGLPLVLLEAMQSALPIIAYECPCGPKDLIDDGINGYLIPVNREDIFIEKLRILIENHKLRKEMGLKGYEKIKQFSQENIILKWQELFNTIKNN